MQYFKHGTTQCITSEQPSGIIRDPSPNKISPDRMDWIETMLVQLDQVALSVADRIIDRVGIRATHKPQKTLSINSKDQGQDQQKVEKTILHPTPDESHLHQQDDLVDRGKWKPCRGLVQISPGTTLASQKRQRHVKAVQDEEQNKEERHDWLPEDVSLACRHSITCFSTCQDRAVTSL